MSAVANARGHVSDADIKAVKNAGYNDAQVVEIVLHVALNTLTNYVNEVANTEIDFPVVSRQRCGYSNPLDMLALASAAARALTQPSRKALSSEGGLLLL